MLGRFVILRARWHTSDLDSETQVFDLDLVYRDGRQLGGISRIKVKRAGPGEALFAAGSGRCHPVVAVRHGWQELCAAGSRGAEPEEAIRPWWSPDSTKLAAALAGLHPFDPDHESGPFGASC